MPHRPLKLFKPANPNPIYLALPVPSHATTGTAPVCASSLSQCLTTNASVFLCGPHGMVCPLLLGTMCNKLSFQCLLSPDLLALLYLNYSINTHIQNRSGKLSTLSYSLSSICTWRDTTFCDFWQINVPWVSYSSIHTIFLLNTQARAMWWSIRSTEKVLVWLQNLTRCGLPPCCEELDLVYWQMRGHVSRIKAP